MGSCRSRSCGISREGEVQGWRALATLDVARVVAPHGVRDRCAREVRGGGEKGFGARRGRGEKGFGARRGLGREGVGVPREGGAGRSLVQPAIAHEPRRRAWDGTLGLGRGWRGASSRLLRGGRVMNQRPSSSPLPHHNLIAYRVAVELLVAVRDARVRDAGLREALRAAKSASRGRRSSSRGTRGAWASGSESASPRASGGSWPRSTTARSQAEGPAARRARGPWVRPSAAASRRSLRPRPARCRAPAPVRATMVPASAPPARALASPAGSLSQAELARASARFAVAVRPASDR
jgi:hypothetical protein